MVHIYIYIYIWGRPKHSVSSLYKSYGGGKSLEIGRGSAWLGSAWPSPARIGSDRLGSAWLGSAHLGSARPGPARLGSVWLSSALPPIPPSAKKVPQWLPATGRTKEHNSL